MVPYRVQKRKCLPTSNGTPSGSVRATRCLSNWTDRERAPQVSRAMNSDTHCLHGGSVRRLVHLHRSGERAFGIQIATAIMYTYFVFWYVFFPTRGLVEKYSLRNEKVQRRIPLLLAIHCAFLMSIFLGETIWLSMKPHLPNYWFTEHGRRGASLYASVMICSFVVLFFVRS